MDFLTAFLNMFGGGQIAEAQKEQQQQAQQPAPAETKSPSVVKTNAGQTSKGAKLEDAMTEEGRREWGWIPQEDESGITSWQPIADQAQEEQEATSAPAAAGKIESSQEQAGETGEAQDTGWDGLNQYTYEPTAKPSVSSEGSSKKTEEVNPYYDESQLEYSWIPSETGADIKPSGGLTYGDIPQYAENGVPLFTDYDLLMYNVLHPENLRGGRGFGELSGGTEASPSWDWYAALPEIQSYVSKIGERGINPDELTRLQGYKRLADEIGTDKNIENAANGVADYQKKSKNVETGMQSFIDSKLIGDTNESFDTDAALKNYLSKFNLSKNYTPGTGYMDMLDEQNMGSMGTDAKQSIAGTNQSADEVVEKAAAENYYRPAGIETTLQGDLANAFRQSLEGNEDARNYYTEVSSKIYDYYQDAFYMTHGYAPPYNNLFDFCMYGTEDEFWEYAQFTHSYFGMYTGPNFDNPDGTLNEEAFRQFYNDCKVINQVSKLFKLNGNGEKDFDVDVVGAFVSDFKTAHDLATFLIKSGLVDQDLTQALWAANAVGDATSDKWWRNREQGYDIWQDAYDQLEADTKIGGYQPYNKGGEFSAQSRLLPDEYMGDWSDEAKAALPYTIANDDSLSWIGLAPQIADTIAYSEGWGWNQGRNNKY